MAASFLIMLREGLEAALIVGIICAYLARTNRSHLIRRVWLGVAAAVGISVLAGAALTATTSELPEAWEEGIAGFTGLAAVGVLTWMIFWMRRQARTIKGHLEQKVETALESGAQWALPAMAFFAVGREGLESVLFLFSTFKAGQEAATFSMGAVLGLALAVGLGYGIYRGGVHLNLRRLFQVTGAFIVLVAGGILAYSIHELEEAGIIASLGPQAWNLSGLFGKGSVIDSFLGGILGYRPSPTWAEVGVWLAYVVPTMTAFFWPHRPRPVIEPAAPVPALEEG